MKVSAVEYIMTSDKRHIFTTTVETCGTELCPLLRICANGTKQLLLSGKSVAVRGIGQGHRNYVFLQLQYVMEVKTACCVSGGQSICTAPTPTTPAKHTHKQNLNRECH